MGVAAGVAAATVAGVAGSAISGSAASSAAGQQSAASQLGIQAQQDQYRNTQGLEAPYIDTGTEATNQLYAKLQQPGGLVSQQALEQTPGYQFTLAQGLQSVQNSAAARGLGVSGAALKGAANYATGLANNTYQQQYQDAYNSLFSLGQLGAQSTNALAGVGTQTANGIQSGENAIGNAQAAGTVGTANALSSGIGAVGGAYTNYLQANALNNYLNGMPNGQPTGPGIDPNTTYPGSGAIGTGGLF